MTPCDPPRLRLTLASPTYLPAPLTQIVLGCLLPLYFLYRQEHSSRVFYAVNIRSRQLLDDTEGDGGGGGSGDGGSSINGSGGGGGGGLSRWIVPLCLRGLLALVCCASITLLVGRIFGIAYSRGCRAL